MVLIGALEVFRNNVARGLALHFRTVGDAVTARRPIAPVHNGARALCKAQNPAPIFAENARKMQFDYKTCSSDIARPSAVTT